MTILFYLVPPAVIMEMFSIKNKNQRGYTPTLIFIFNRSIKALNYMIYELDHQLEGCTLISYCTNYLATVPDITVYMNCDTRLAINLRLFDLGENDEFIFAIKNYSYIDSSYVFLFRARKADIDENGEVIFKITPAASKKLKPGAFYNFAILSNAFDPKKETEYKKITDNGNIIIEYGAQDLLINPEAEPNNNYNNCEIISIRLELLDAISSIDSNKYRCEVLGVRLELLDEISSIKPESILSEIIDMRLEPLINS